METCRVQNENYLVWFIALPDDVVFEILKLVNPFDLLQLARTSKSLRTILMHRSSQLIWKEARSSVEGLPDCPAILSEPAYARLMFDERCSQCLAPHPEAVSWGLLSRWCGECTRSEFDTVKVKIKIGNLKLVRFIPQVLLLISRGVGRTITFYHTETHHLLEDEYVRIPSPSEKKAWLLKKTSAFEEIEKQIMPCRIWFRRQAKRQWKQSRKRAVDEVIRRLELLGWGEVIAKSNHNLITTLSGDIFQRDMTDEVWESQKFHFIAVMRREERFQLEKTVGQRIKDCQPLLIQIREDYRRSSPVNTIIPPRANFYKHLTAFHTVIINSPHGTKFTLEHFRMAISLLPDLIPTWIKITNARLLKIMEQAMGKEVRLDISHLSLATALFNCTLCGTERLNHEPCDSLISYPRVLVHRGAVKDFDSATPRSEKLQQLDDFTNQSLYNYHHTIGFSKDVHDRVTSLVRLCGLDPLTTTAQQMDELNSIFAPVNDSDSPMDQRLCMTWRRTVLYAKSHPHSQIELVQGETRDNARKLLDQEQMNQWTQNQNHICVHCREKGNLIQIQSHVQEIHGCLNPTKKDFAVFMDADIILHPVAVQISSRRISENSL